MRGQGAIKYGPCANTKTWANVSTIETILLPTLIISLQWVASVLLVMWVLYDPPVASLQWGGRLYVRRQRGGVGKSLFRYSLSNQAIRLASLRKETLLKKKACRKSLIKLSVNIT